jgi:hypothetical protein
VKGGFDFKLQALWIRMMGEVMAIVAPFLAFSSTYITTKAHNMLMLMLDPHFKSLDVAKGFVGKEKVIHMVVEYDNRSLMPFLVATFKIQNLGVLGPSKAIIIDDDELIFWVMASNEVILHGWLKNELGLFRHLPMKSKTIYCP